MTRERVVVAQLFRSASRRFHCHSASCIQEATALRAHVWECVLCVFVSKSQRRWVGVTLCCMWSHLLGFSLHEHLQHINARTTRQCATYSVLADTSTVYPQSYGTGSGLTHSSLVSKLVSASWPHAHITRMSTSWSSATVSRALCNLSPSSPDGNFMSSFIAPSSLMRLR